MTPTRRQLVLGISMLLGSVALRAAAHIEEAAPPLVEVLLRGLRHPWSLAFLPDSALLVTEKQGGLRLVRAMKLNEGALPGSPTGVLASGDSGLLDVVLDPQFARNGFVYLAFTEGTMDANRPALWRARWDGDALLDGRVIYRGAVAKKGNGHSGGRMVFLADETLLLTTGEGYDYKDLAQDLRSHYGKVLRLDRDGHAPRDNPFQGRADALPEIWTLGHRNPLGLLRDPRDDRVWEHEMGPRGGDEINLLRAGANYGWPRTSWGTDYDGTMITPLLQAPGMEDPVVVFNPSISPSGFALYLGDAFPHWRGDFLVGALSGKHLRRVRVRDGIAVLEEVLLHQRDTRIRDVRVGPDGLVYLLTDGENGELWRLRPG